MKLSKLTFCWRNLNFVFTVGMVQLGPLKKKETQPDIQPSCPEVSVEVWIVWLFIALNSIWNIIVNLLLSFFIEDDEDLIKRLLSDFDVSDGSRWINRKTCLHSSHKMWTTPPQYTPWLRKWLSTFKALKNFVFCSFCQVKRYT